MAFVNASVVPMDAEGILSEYTVVIREDRIVEIGPSASISLSEEIQQIDATGKYLVPGMAEMHGHIPPPGQRPQYTEDVLFLYVANGITTVRGMQGAEGQLQLKQRIEDGEIVGPNLYLAGPAFSGGSIRTPEHAIERTLQQAEEGWHLLKVLPGLSLEEYDAMARTAHDAGIRFAGHVPADVGIMHAIAEGQDTFDHIDGYVEYLRSVDSDTMNEAALADVLEATKEAGAWVVPTMALWEVLQGTIEPDVLKGYGEVRYMPSDIVDGWIQRSERQRANPAFDLDAADRLIDARMKVLRAMHDNGVGILFGTDAPQVFSVPGFSLHRELARMVDAGMPPYAILESGTKNVGEYFTNEDQFGTIAPGSRADLLLLGSNPLEDISNLRDLAGVMVRGSWMAREEIDATLEAIEDRYADDQ